MPSRFSRFTQAVRTIGRRVLEELAGPQPRPQPQPPPRPYPAAPPPRPYDWAAEEILVPTDTGEWVTEEAAPAPEEEEPYWFGEEPTIYDANGFEVETDRPMTFEDWYTESFLPKRYLVQEYGVDNMQILHELERQGYEIDWNAWWQEYHERYGYG